MSTEQETENIIVTVVRWAARISGTLLALLVVLLAVGEGIPGPWKLTATENLLFAALIMMLSGLMIAWRFEGSGGILVIGGFVFFSVVNRSISPGIISLFPVVGLAFLFCWWRSRNRLEDRKRDAEGHST